ncbi:hypothetical protein Bca4012_048355 [Brassica carinata]|uniref:Uncharacterized protein n=1 Tax=Brassica carinata TaxID=52824 RepID=A0A8X7R583_BRACI|nr:hypothetical protein Bca52824_051333 [Brassica carinata]
MVKLCFHVSSISHFLCCVFVSSFFVKTLVSQPFPRPDQIEILLAFKNEFPILKYVKSFDGVVFDNDTGVVTKLDLLGACLSGTLRANSSLFRFHHLRYLDLSYNYFDSFSFLPELSKLTNLEVLDLSYMGLAGEISSSFSSLNRLTHLTLSGNELIGSFSPLFNLSRLSFLSLFDNHFSGNIHCSLLTMPFLSSLDLSHNHLTDSLEIMNCSSSSKLQLLDLTYLISKLTNLKELHLTSQNTTDPINFVSLGFKSFRVIGSFWKTYRSYMFLYMVNNMLKGEVPKWLWSMPSLNGLLLSGNSLNSFEGSPIVVLNSSLISLDLRSNDFRGSLPIISPGLAGSVPRCPTYSTQEAHSLRILDVSHNQIAGKLPINRIVDLFPFWLKDLPNLKVVVLRSNMFHGPIYSHQHPLSFPQLRMVDISRNKFTGRLPHDYFVTWSTPMIGTPREAREPLYIGDDYSYRYHAPSAPEEHHLKPPKREQVLNWKAVAMGYGPGVLFGQVLYSYKPVLFYKLFRL